jgi:hypothetical protein
MMTNMLHTKLSTMKHVRRHCLQRDGCDATSLYVIVIQGYSKRSIQFQKFILQKLLKLNPCHVYGWKGNLSKFWYRWSEAAHHWGCGSCYLWRAATSVGRAGLSIWHLPHHTWGSHQVLVRCENIFESSPFSLYIARRHMFDSTCKINFWKCVFLFEQLCIFINFLCMYL